MFNKKIILSVFILVALAQLYVPAKMILDKEKILNAGEEYKFKAAPIDPNDPFRGKYITLRYEENTVEIKDKTDWTKNETIYVSIEKNAEGFAKIQSVSKEKPEKNQTFLMAKVRYVTAYDSTKTLTIDYPFDRFYMEESKAQNAETTYRKSLQDTSRITYALVAIKDGNAVLKDVLIDGISIREIVEEER